MIPYLSALYDNALCSDGGMTQIIRSRAEEGLAVHPGTAGGNALR